MLGGYNFLDVASFDGRTSGEWNIDVKFNLKATKKKSSVPDLIKLNCIQIIVSYLSNEGCQ